jgi:hypothetical protein
MSTTTSDPDTDSLPYECSICGARLADLEHAHDHVTSHHPERLTEAVRGIMTPR